MSVLVLVELCFKMAAENSSQNNVHIYQLTSHQQFLASQMVSADISSKTTQHAFKFLVKLASKRSTQTMFGSGKKRRHDFFVFPIAFAHNTSILKLL